MGNFALTAALYASGALFCAAFCAFLTYKSLRLDQMPPVLNLALALSATAYYASSCALGVAALVLLEAAQRLLCRLGETLRIILERVASALNNIVAPSPSEEELRKVSGTAFAAEARKELGRQNGYAAAALIMFFALLGFMAARILRKNAPTAAVAAIAALHLRLILLKAAVYAVTLLLFLLPLLLFS